MTHHEGNPRLIETTLPSGETPNMVVVPTMNRWLNHEETGPLPKMIGSVQHAISEAGMKDNTFMVVNDGTNSPYINEVRAQQLNKTVGENHSRLFIMSPELQRKVADEIIEATGTDQKIVDAVLTETGYGSQRVKLDVVGAGIAIASGTNTRKLTFDDDTYMRPGRVRLAESRLPQGMTPEPNTQVLFDQTQVSEDMYRKDGKNDIGDFFSYLGKTVKEVRKETHPGMRATTNWRDNMSQQLESVKISSNGDAKESVQFTVTYDDTADDPNLDNAVIVGVSSTKFGKPDYRSVYVANLNLRDRFPQGDISMISIPSGSYEPFAFRRCDSIVDSACFSREVNGNTMRIPWWYVSSIDISLANPLKTVTGHYRADNDMIPEWLQVIYNEGQGNFAYMAGISAQVEHFRAQNGYRQDIINQACASSIGNAAALEAARHVYFDPITGRVHIRATERNYQTPDQLVTPIFEKFLTLSNICTSQIAMVDQERTRTNDPATVNHLAELLLRYENTKRTLQEKFAGFNYKEFKLHLSREINDQLTFYSAIVDALPNMMNETARMIRQGRYPVYEFVR